MQSKSTSGYKTCHLLSTTNATIKQHDKSYFQLFILIIMVAFMREQDKANHVSWLATSVGKTHLGHLA